MVPTLKVPMLKPGEYEFWRMRMEHYIQMIDYSLWEVIENGNAPPVTKIIEGVETIIAPSTAKEKAQRRLELKARTNHLLQAIEKKFREGMLATKATQMESFKADAVGDFIRISNCSSSCLKNVKILKEQNEQLLKDLRTSKINSITYKTGNFMPPKPNLSFSGLEEFVNEPIVSEPAVKKPVVETSEAKASADKPKAVKKNNGAPIIEDWVSDSEEEDMPQAKIQKKIVKPSFAKIEFVKSKEQVKTPRKTTVKQGNQNRQNTHSPRGNQRNWNNMMSQRLGSNFEMINKACYVCGSFDHLQHDCNYNISQF
ncbi:hypothetical protein Tco_1204542 [Tanacetum coccineum]